MHSAAAYRSLVERLEREAATRPGWYRFKLTSLAALGYAFLLTAVTVALALSVGIGVLLLLSKSVWAIKLIKFVWIPLVLAYLILKALWVRFSGPDGRLLRPGEAPALEAEVERLRQATGAPRLSGIVIDSNFNAAAASVPRMLGLAGSRHFLVLGLPLMRALGPQQLAAVIAHEFGHFNAGHGTYAGWIYRIRVSWYRLLDSMQQQGSMLGGLFTRFFSWYAPYFNAYSFVLARDNEYEADAVAARLVGAESLGQALVRTELASHRLATRFWPEVERLNLSQPQPPQSLYDAMTTAIRARDSSDAESLTLALQRNSGLDDTHPTLAQRLRALGVAAELPETPNQCAAEQFLGPLADTLQHQFDTDWMHAATSHWEERYRSHAEGRERLQQLHAQRQQRELDASEALEYAMLVDDLQPREGERSGVESAEHPADASLPSESAADLYAAALQLDPDSALAHFRLGFLQLQRDGDDAVAHLESAMRLDPECAGHALHLLATRFEQRGDDEALDAIRVRQKAWIQQQESAAAARQNLHARDTFETHGLTESHVESLRAQIAAHGKIGKAWLVRKRVPGDEGVPHHILLVQWRGIVVAEQSQLQRLLDSLEVPGTLYAVTIDVGYRIRRRIKRAAGKPLHGKGWLG